MSSSRGAGMGDATLFTLIVVTFIIKCLLDSIFVRKPRNPDDKTNGKPPPLP